MGPWGNIAIGLLTFACGVLLIVAQTITDGYVPVAWMGFAMVVFGAGLTVVGTIGAGVRSGNEATRR